jgi:hypothetical protein
LGLGSESYLQSSLALSSFVQHCIGDFGHVFETAALAWLPGRVPPKNQKYIFEFLGEPVRKYWAQMSAMAADDSSPVIRQASFE